MTTNGKTALVTGSTDGVGRHVAERLAAQAGASSSTAAIGPAARDRKSVV